VSGYICVLGVSILPLFHVYSGSVVFFLNSSFYHQCHHIVAHYMYNEDMSSFVMKICMMLHKIVTKTLYDSNDKEEEFSRTDIINML
jgi:hypothetical protein